MILTGSYNRSLDEKLRVAIPKEVRDVLLLQSGGAMYVAPGTDGSLVLYTEAEFSRFAERLEASSPTQQNVRAFIRLFYSQAHRVEVDRQGRIRIPPELAERAKLKKDVMLLGVRDHLELWDLQQWQAYWANKSDDYDNRQLRKSRTYAVPAPEISRFSGPARHPSGSDWKS